MKSSCDVAKSSQTTIAKDNDKGKTVFQEKQLQQPTSIASLSVQQLQYDHKLH